MTICFDASLRFRQNGEGAVTHDALDKLGLSVSVLDFIPKAHWAAIMDGTTAYDASTDVQAAHDYIRDVLTSGTLDFHGLQLRMDSGISWDPENVSLKGNGARLYFGYMTTGAAITVVNDETTSGLDRPLRNAAHPMAGLQLIGPGVDVTEVVAVLFNDTNPDPEDDEYPFVLSNVTISACAFEDFATDLDLRNGAFCLRIRECTFCNTSADVPTTPSINIPSDVINAGERNGFLGCQWFARKHVLIQSNPDATTFFTDCSLDYGDVLITLSGGRVGIVNCHIEGSTDVGHWISVTGANTSLTVRSTVLVLSALLASNKTVYSPFYCDSTAVYGGIDIDGLSISQGQVAYPWSTSLIAGTGRVKIDNICFYQAGARPLLSTYANRLAHGDFESASSLAGDGWVTTANATRSNSSPVTGTWSLRIEGEIGVPHSAYVLIPALPGEYFSGQLEYVTTALAGTAGWFNVEAGFTDAGGNYTAAAEQLGTQANVAKTTLPLRIIAPAPPGTAYLKLLVQLFDVTSGAPFGRVDSVVVNLA